MDASIVFLAVCWPIGEMRRILWVLTELGSGIRRREFQYLSVLSLLMPFLGLITGMFFSPYIPDVSVLTLLLSQYLIGFGIEILLQKEIFFVAAWCTRLFLNGVVITALLGLYI